MIAVKREREAGAYTSLIPIFHLPELLIVMLREAGLIRLA
jgi:hypothetical protein